MVKADVMDEHEYIYNIDETGFVKAPAAGKVQRRRGRKNWNQNTDGSEKCQHVAKHLYGSWCEGGPKGACYAMMDHGWAMDE